MESNIKKSIIDGMIKKNLVECWEERLSDDVTIHKVEEENEDLDDIAYTSDGVRYSKKAVFTYLAEKGCTMDQTNVELAAKMISENEGNVVIKKYKTKKHHNLENTTDQDLLSYINYKILEEIEVFKTHIMLEQFVDYKVEIVNDVFTGGVASHQLIEILEKYSSLGWKLKSVFTNERRKNLLSSELATYEQTILIFERSKFITNKDAIEMIKKYKNQ